MHYIIYIVCWGSRNKEEMRLQQTKGISLTSSISLDLKKAIGEGEGEGIRKDASLPAAYLKKSSYACS